MMSDSLGRSFRTSSCAAVATAAVLLVVGLVACRRTAAPVIGPTRAVEIRDWTISVPADARQSKTDGADFTVTYFEFPGLQATLGVYEGAHPRLFAGEKTKVSRTEDKIGGRKVVWDLWTETKGGKQTSHAETQLVSTVFQLEGAPTRYVEQLHLFLSAPDEPTAEAIRSIARTLQQTGTPPPPPPPK